MGLTLGRPLGSRNKATREFRAVVAELDRRGEIDLRRLVLSLYEDATSKDPSVRIPSRREMLSRVWGLPRQAVEVEHGVSESGVALLVRIATSDAHRRVAEELEDEREQRRLAAITVETD
jgi:hypothetical protein